jgi:hypothetical protein
MTLLILDSFVVKMISLVICVIGLYRNVGFPKLTKEFAMSILKIEFTSNILYLIAISMPPGK